MPWAIYPILTIDKNKFRFPKWVGSCGRKAFLQAVLLWLFPVGLEHKMNYGIFYFPLKKQITNQ
jgi:hypothetical protein